MNSIISRSFSCVPPQFSIHVLFLRPGFGLQVSVKSTEVCRTCSKFGNHFAVFVEFGVCNVLFTTRKLSFTVLCSALQWNLLSMLCLHTFLYFSLMSIFASFSDSLCQDCSVFFFVLAFASL